MKSIALFQSIGWGSDYMKKALEEKGFSVDIYEGPLDKDHLPEARSYDAVSIFVGSEVDKEVLDAFSSLSLVTTRSTGFNHIAIEACREKGVKVGYVPHYGEHTVAEFAMGLILTLSRKLFPAVDRIKEKSEFSFEGLEGFDLKGKTLGVIGTGRIGRHLIKMAQGFDMRIVAFDAFPDEAYAKDVGITYMTLDEVLASSDVVTLHLPYTDETHHILDRDKLFSMKKGALLINTARGALVETAGLLEALQSEHLGGAGLDVLEEEGIAKDEMGFLLRKDEGHDLRAIVANHVLMDMENVVITPHTAFNTREAKQRIYDGDIANIVSFFEKGELVDEVL